MLHKRACCLGQQPDSTRSSRTNRNVRLPVGSRDSSIPKGKLIRADREQQGLSQKALVALSGRFSEKTLRRAEAAKGRVSTEYLHYIAAALGMPKDRYIATDDDEYIELYAALVGLLKGEIIEKMNFGPPQSNNLDNKTCERMYWIIQDLGKSVYRKLRAVEGQFIHSRDMSKLNFRRSNPPVLHCGSVGMRKHVDYIAHMDDVIKDHKFNGDIIEFCNLLVENEKEVSSGALIIIPADISWDADGGYPDGMGDSDSINFFSDDALALSTSLEVHDLASNQFWRT